MELLPEDVGAIKHTSPFDFIKFFLVIFCSKVSTYVPFLYFSKEQSYNISFIDILLSNLFVFINLTIGKNP